MIQLLEVYNPPNVMKWILFWSNTTGRGILLCFFSLIAMNGFLFTGLVSLFLSFAVLLSPIIFQTHDAPKCLYETFLVNKVAPVHDNYGSTTEKSEILALSTTSYDA
jgi:hypothetical protein